MTPEQITQVRSSFALTLPRSGQIAAAFYERLFRTTPQLRPMFKTDIAEQGRKLMLTLATIVANLDKLDVLLPEAAELARRHQLYGVRDAHYALVGTALIETLRAELGERFTPAIEAAWSVAYQALSGAMIASAKDAA
ncbi:MAG: globin family protein [Sphingomonadaceae bacterium]